MKLNSQKIAFLIQDFVEIQRYSFLTFLKKGLVKELSKRNPLISVPQDIELIFFPKNYQLKKPEFTSKEAILQSKTYACKIYVPVQIIEKKVKKIRLEWVLLGHLPLMTKRGHFILNGSPRVIVNQLVRSPGIYYQEHVDTKGRITHYADIIPQRGTWLRLEADKKSRFWARMKKTPKISLVLLIQTLASTQQDMVLNLHYSEVLKSSYLKNHPNSIKQAFQRLYIETRPNPKKEPLTTMEEFRRKRKLLDQLEPINITPSMGCKFLIRKLLNPKTYDLGEVGRFRLNKKLGSNVTSNQYTLTKTDLLYATDYLIKLENGIGSLDDIDNLKNRRIRTSGELIQNQFATGLMRLEKMIRKKIINSSKSIFFSRLITTKPINGAFREFFGSSPFSQYMDQTNPLAEITHKRRLSSLGPGGVNRDTAGMDVRGIHPTHYGRICPIETPEGRNAGLVNSLTIFARLDSQGFLKTPFYNVFRGQVQKNFGPLFFSANQEELIKIAPGDVNVSEFNFLPKVALPIRVAKEFRRIPSEQIEYIGISPLQMISIATSLIPFLEHDDANRALMGSNMQRQALPLLIPESPLVGTGLEARVASDSGHVIQAKESGIVSYVSSNKIIVHTFAPSNITSHFNFTTKDTLNYSVVKTKKVKPDKVLLRFYFIETNKKNLSFLISKILQQPILNKKKFNKPWVKFY